MSTPVILLVFAVCASIAFYFGVVRVGREYDAIVRAKAASPSPSAASPAPTGERGAAPVCDCCGAGPMLDRGGFYDCFACGHNREKAYQELNELQQLQRDNTLLKRQLDRVDECLQWQGTGRGRIESIEILRAHHSGAERTEAKRERIGECGDVAEQEQNKAGETFYHPPLSNEHSPIGVPGEAKPPSPTCPKCGSAELEISYWDEEDHEPTSHYTLVECFGCKESWEIPPDLKDFAAFFPPAQQPGKK